MRRETHNLSMLTAFTSSALNPTNARRPWCFGGARGVVVIVLGNGHGDTSSNPGRD